MTRSVRQLVEQVEGLRIRLTAVKSPQVQSHSLRHEIRNFIESYFNEVRPSIISNDQQNNQVKIIDAAMQDLFPLCHKRGRTNAFKSKIRAIKGHLIDLETHVVVTGSPTSKAQTSLDLAIIKKLEEVLPSAALSYRQGLHDLGSASRFSWRGPATDLRESLRETLDFLAPDKEVKSVAGFAIEEDAKGPTMKQKVKYILAKRGLSRSKGETTENAADAIDLMVGAFVRSVYTRSSISTHTPTEKGEVLTIHNLVRVVLSELLELNEQ